ncbi:MAG: AlpA family phage regulatory protein [Hyphomicrobiaceae bacterium TMED74]|nr:AlpA family transcriptional regulator [Filomicrobium sp.]RPG37030.1 MAG: AlpA family phage regulatory protein [Hyphomicrobiaceae bacterium TMED74]
MGKRARSTIYNDLAEKRLPPPIKLGGRVYWIEAEVDDWLFALRSEVTDITYRCTDREDGLTEANCSPRSRGGE